MPKFRFLAALLSLVVVLPAATAAEPFRFLQPGDTTTLDCGTFIHDRGTEPSPENLRLFMNTKGTLFLRTDQGLRTVHLDRADAKARESGMIGRGDRIDFRFSAEGKERLRLMGTVTEAVLDDDGSYPILEFDAHVTYTNPQGKKVSRQFAVSDLCL